MPKTIRVNLAIPVSLARDLQKLIEKYGFDRTNAIRYCIRRTCDEELAAGAAESGVGEGVKKERLKVS